MDLSSKKYLHWGNGLIVAITLFILGMLGMVYIAFRQTNDMVEDNYYERELKYQKIIDAKNNLTPYDNFTFLSITPTEIEIRLPQEVSESLNHGSIRFLKMDNQKLDRNFDLTSSKQSIQKSDLKPGVYNVKIQWTNHGKDYFHEQEFSL